MKRSHAIGLALGLVALGIPFAYLLTSRYPEEDTDPSQIVAETAIEADSGRRARNSGASSTREPISFAQAPGRDHATGGVTTNAGSDAQVVVIGTIVDTAGFPVDSEGVEVFASKGSSRHSGSQTGGNTFSLIGLSPGEWRVSAKAVGYFEWSGQVTIAGAQAEDLQVVLRPCRQLPVYLSIAGREPAELGDSVISILSSSYLSVGAYQPCSSANGETPVFEHALHVDADKLNLGSLRLSPAGPDPICVALLLGETTVDHRQVYRSAQSVEFRCSSVATLEPGGISFEAIDEATGRPIQSGRARLESGYVTRVEKLSPSGAAFFNALPPGRARLSIDGSSGRLVSIDVEVPAGSHQDLGCISVPLRKTLNVRIVDSGMAPVAGATVFVFPRDWQSDIDLLGPRYEASGDGEAQVVLPPSGEAVVRAWTEDASSKSILVTEDVIDGTWITAKLDDPAEPVRLDFSGWTARTAWVLEDSRSLPLAAGSVVGPAATVSGIPEGSYTLRRATGSRDQALDAAATLQLGDR